ncbi:MAG: shikimate kinase [Bryobacteraceae bacterium]
MNSVLIRYPGLYLVGFMGCGKTTVGLKLADELGWSFADLDDDIEATAGEPIPSIFDTRGEPEFRRLEHEALEARLRLIRRGQPAVLSLGGGAFAQQNNFELLHGHGVSIWLDAPFELIQRRIAGQEHRPLARDPEKFAALYHARQSAYARADYRIEIDGDDPAVAVRAILALPMF